MGHMGRESIKTNRPTVDDTPVQVRTVALAMTIQYTQLSNSCTPLHRVYMSELPIEIAVVVLTRPALLDWFLAFSSARSVVSRFFHLYCFIATIDCGE